jgi:hypothetical protein
MTKGEAFAKIRRLSPENRLAFNRWLQGCAVIGSILGIGLVAMAVAGSWLPRKTESEQLRALSFQEQHELAHQENLPVQQFEDLTHVFVAEPRPLVPPTVSPSGNSSASR